MNASEFFNSEGRLRVLSALVLGPLVLGVTYLGGPSFAAIIILMTMAGLYEWLRLVDQEAPLAERCGLFASLVVAEILAAAGGADLGMIAIVMATAIFYAQRSNVSPERALWFALGLPYMAASGVAMIYLRSAPAGGALILYLFAAVWGMDIGGYVAGRLIGGPKLAPAISPNKTWAGFLGGAVLGSVSAALVLLLTHAAHVATGAFVALLLTVSVQAGDLFKSLFKRRAGVKDCGTLIPGHGGMLDRIDGLVFAAMLLAVLRVFFGDGMIGW